MRRNLESVGIPDHQIEDIADLVHAHMRKGYRPKSKLVPNCIETLEQLRARGLLVGILTNRSRSIYTEMADLGLDQYLDLFLTAGQLNAFKPDAKFFSKPL
jgi:FMN phosphatase YigB (HAD superfamily)